MHELAGPHPVDLPAFAGSWHVVRTTLPYWERRRDPRITYRLLPDGRIDDLVEHGRGRVHGIDTQDPALPRLFHWRGTGLLTRWLTSDWYLLAHDPSGGAAVPGHDRVEVGVCAVQTAQTPISTRS